MWYLGRWGYCMLKGRHLLTLISRNLHIVLMNHEHTLSSKVLEHKCKSNFLPSNWIVFQSGPFATRWKKWPSQPHITPPSSINSRFQINFPLHLSNFYCKKSLAHTKLSVHWEGKINIYSGGGAHSHLYLHNMENSLELACCRFSEWEYHWASLSMLLSQKSRDFCIHSIHMKSWMASVK